ncbi:MAG: hypothetical protein ACI4PY_02425 [Akkermansia muciniphila]|nr:hypothetical protein [Akkermansia muciniphila]
MLGCLAALSLAACGGDSSSGSSGSFGSSPLTHEATAGCRITTEGQHSASRTLLAICQSDGLE